MPSKQKSSPPPSFVPGRKGQTSVVDCMVRLLWKQADESWPERTFADLRDEVSKLQGYRVTASTIRSSAYDHDDLFEKVKGQDGVLRWRLTRQARKGPGAGS